MMVNRESLAPIESNLKNMNEMRSNCDQTLLEWKL